jgi:hypothetical protein
MIAALRPNDWNWLLLFHLLSSFLLVAGVVSVALASLAADHGAWPHQVPLLRALAFRINLVVVVPAFVAVHVFGDLLSNREYHGHEPDWLSIGFTVTDVTAIVAVALAFLQFWVLRRARVGQLGGWPARLVSYLPAVVLAALMTVIVLMAAKPVS